MTKWPRENDKPGPERLTVVIRDESPLIHIGEPVRFRTAVIELTESQRAALSLRQVSTIKGMPIHEEISYVIAEPNE